MEIRPIGPDDKAGLAAGFERLSERSRYRRFLSPTERLTSAQLAYLTEIDHRDHEALVALEPSSRDGLGVARYVRTVEDPHEAEAAIAVADDWQQRGLGTALLRHLAARAREEGVERFTGLVHEDNQAVRHMLEAFGEVRERHAGAGAVEVSLEIPEDPLDREHEQGLASWMRAAAQGLLRSTFAARSREPR